MKHKLLKEVREAANNCAHIYDYMVNRYLTHDEIIGVSIGYGIYDITPYRDVWKYNMSIKEYDRRIRQIYWSLNKESYYNKYRTKTKTKTKWKIKKEKPLNLKQFIAMVQRIITRM